MSPVKQNANSRRERAALTRRRMLDAAYDLFCADGYRATTMDAIADRAGVAVQTLYFTFHTKDELLQEVHDRTVLGHDQVPPPQQAWHIAALAEPDAWRAMALIVEGVATILARVAPMVPVAHAVAGDPAGAMFDRSEQLRREGYTVLVNELVKKAPLVAGMSRPRATDLLLVLLGPEIYRSLVLETGWTRRQWMSWTTDTLTRSFFGTPGAL